MKKFYVKQKIYRYLVNGHYSDLWGIIVQDAQTGVIYKVTKAEIRSFADNNILLNAVYTSNGVLRHKEGTPKIRSTKIKPLKRENKSSGNIIYLHGYSLINYIDKALAGVVRKRFCYNEIVKYLSAPSDYVLGLYGLRRTGKTTMMLQAIRDIEKRGIHCLYITLRNGNSIEDLYKLLKSAFHIGYRYVFIDEITFMQDFIKSCSVLADFYTKAGMKIVISGTFSMSLRAASNDALYDRIKLIETGYISFKEQHYLTNCSLADYLKTGGVLIGSTGYQNSHEYVDVSIVRNILSSLEYSYTDMFKDLRVIHESNDLTAVIQRVLDNTGEVITEKALNADFKSQRLSSALELLKKYGENIPNEHRLMSIREALHIALEVRRYNNITYTDKDIVVVRKYLNLLGVLYSYKDYANNVRDILIIPWLSHAQTIELFDVLENDEQVQFLKQSYVNYDRLRATILSDTYGRLLENIIFFETVRASRNNNFFNVTQFEFVDSKDTNVEIDMITIDTSNSNEVTVITLYEVKNSESIYLDGQVKNICNEEVLTKFSHYNNAIIKYSVIYNGESKTEQYHGKTINYINAEWYLLNLKDDKPSKRV